MTNSTPIEFKRAAVEPVECLKQGWNLIKDQYWLFVGMSFVGLMIANFVPFGILIGPMMCGIYLALFRMQRKQPVQFGDLFKGFDYFGESVIATLFHMVPIILILATFYIAILLGMFLVLPSSGDRSDPTGVIIFFSILTLGGIGMMLAIVVLSILFAFAYPLIVDRRLSGIEAVKLSAKAGMANFGRLFGLLLLNGLLSFVGLLLCYVGIFLVLPLSFAAMAVAYQQVFGLGEVQQPGPPPPPIFT